MRGSVCFGIGGSICVGFPDLEKEYDKSGEIENFKFLKQYLTLNRAELFFADKAIFIEGDTERILLPAMMKKIDQVIPENPLLSQNISIVEVGAYSHIFEKFIEFVGIKSLIITDIDGAKKVEKTIERDSMKDGVAVKENVTQEVIEGCEMIEATITTNASLKHFHDGKSELSYFIQLSRDYKLLRWKTKNRKWVSNRKGKLLIVYQTKETNSEGVEYFARSFEDAFFHLNKNILTAPKTNFSSLTKIHLSKFLRNDINVYQFVDKAVGSKPTLAMEILLNSTLSADNKEYTNWAIPKYIEEGLTWLKSN